MARENRAPSSSLQASYEQLGRELLTLGRRVRSKPPLVTGDHPYLEAAIDALCGLLVERGPTRLTDLADALWLDKSTVTRQIATLEAAGLAHRVPDPSDGRAALVGLTDEGRDLLSRVRQGRREGLRQTLSEWSADDVARFAALLERFNREIEAVQRPLLVALPGRRGAR
ncbi:MAG TPA: MarR family transcriptional regulator [Candidatus Angelobacter sp.]|jgi:DNA-binding MarR family transcriptional regulator|nr:MarR family transcriptional regulator [Candidatus Angelobacter sp.]